RRGAIEERAKLPGRLLRPHARGDVIRRLLRPKLLLALPAALREGEELHPRQARVEQQPPERRRRRRHAAAEGEIVVAVGPALAAHHHVGARRQQPGQQAEQRPIGPGFGERRAPAPALDLRPIVDELDPRRDPASAGAVEAPGHRRAAGLAVALEREREGSPAGAGRALELRKTQHVSAADAAAVEPSKRMGWVHDCRSRRPSRETAGRRARRPVGRGRLRADADARRAAGGLRSFTMRVAHVESGRHLYGGARQVLHLIEGLDARGVDNVLVCTAGSAIAAEAAGRCRVIELPLAGDVDPWAVRRLRRALSAARPDIVHVHSRRGADLYAGLAASGAPWRTVLSRRVDQREVAPWARIKYRPYAAIVAISRAVERELVEHV